MREKDERYLKMKKDKEEYQKFYAGLQKELTNKKHELEADVIKNKKAL
jgi:Skp family chaperone for outer membrane proteins